jgi:cytoskeletal protein CcmA (bactofilin family)
MATAGTSSAPPTPPPVPASVPTATIRDRGTVARDAIRAARWTVDGTVKVAKDVEAQAIELRGIVTIGGRLAAGTIRGRGTLEVEGSIEVAERLKLGGRLRAMTTVRAGELDVAGDVLSTGPVRVERSAVVEGRLEAKEVTAATLQLTGAARIPGHTQATVLSATFKESSSFGTIGGKAITLRARPRNVVDKVRFRECDVTVDRIEAESVQLEEITVQFVRAPQIVLGRGCHVAGVEGTVVRQHPSSHVGPESRTPPPYGLRR